VIDARLDARQPLDSLPLTGKSKDHLSPARTEVACHTRSSVLDLD
jgi:hypothetical protein